jgi:hypothetical protein
MEPYLISSDLKIKINPAKIDKAKTKVKRTDKATVQKNKSTEEVQQYKSLEWLFSSLKQKHCWLTQDSISQKEMIELPEFFTQNSLNKSLHVYLKMRNFIIKTYWMNQDQQPRLNFLTVKTMLAGDVGSLLRVFKFLDKEKVINCQENDCRANLKSKAC